MGYRDIVMGMYNCPRCGKQLRTGDLCTCKPKPKKKPSLLKKLLLKILEE